MRKALLLFLTVGLVFGFSACVQTEQRPYYSDNYGPYDRADRYDVGTRIDNQQRRIDQGMASGELTRREADVLIDNLNWIRDEYLRAKRDGRLSQAEIERLSEHLNQNNRMITDKKNNNIRRVYTPMPMPAPAPAPHRDHEKPAGFEARIHQQQKRIDDGARTGELTRKEAEIVQENLDKIRTVYSRMKADGRLTEKEQDKLDKKLDRNDKMIHNKKNNAIERFD